MNVSFGNSFVLTCTAPRKMVAQDDAIKKAKEQGAILGEREYVPEEQHEGKNILWRDVVAFRNSPTKDEQFKSFCLQRGISFKEIDEKEVFDIEAIIDRATISRDSIRYEDEEQFKDMFVVLDVDKLMQNEYFKQEFDDVLNYPENIKRGLSIIGQNKPFEAPKITVIGDRISVSPCEKYTDSHNIIPALYGMGIKKMPFVVPYYAKDDFDKMGILVRD